MGAETSRLPQVKCSQTGLQLWPRHPSVLTSTGIQWLRFSVAPGSSPSDAIGRGPQPPRPARSHPSPIEKLLIMKVQSWLATSEGHRGSNSEVPSPPHAAPHPLPPLLFPRPRHWRTRSLSLARVHEHLPVRDAQNRIKLFFCISQCGPVRSRVPLCPYLHLAGEIFLQAKRLLQLFFFFLFSLLYLFILYLAPPRSAGRKRLDEGSIEQEKKRTKTPPLGRKEFPPPPSSADSGRWNSEELNRSRATA